jgi:hypothetical protein
LVTLVNIGTFAKKSIGLKFISFSGDSSVSIGKVANDINFQSANKSSRLRTFAEYFEVKGGIFQGLHFVSGSDIWTENH